MKMRLNWFDFFITVAVLFLLAEALFFREGPAYVNLIVAVPCLVTSLFYFQIGKKMAFFPAVAFLSIVVMEVIDFFYIVITRA